jgi:hypothetical protein
LAVDAQAQGLPLDVSRLPSPGDQAHYFITVRVVADATWSTWLEAAVVDNGDGTFTISAYVDQAALRGILCRLWDLNATLIAASWAPRGPKPEGGTK